MKKALSLANKERQSRKDIVYLLINVVITLAQLNLPFRGHNEGEVSTNKGIFKGIIELISRYHPPLMIHLQKGQANPKGYPSYLSPTSQNEMIQYSAEILREDIIENIQIAHFFSICLDTTPDIAKKDQLSIVVRYVNINGEIIESLLDLIEVANCTAVGLVTTIVEVFSKHGLLIESLRGQGYDGCATMAGRYNGVQNLIKVKNPKAYFVHCYVHRLNLVIIDTCKRNVITRNFFGIMQKLYAFIEGSTKRHGLFKDIQMKCYASQGEGKKIGTLKSLSDTRWSSRAEACQVLLENISVLLKVLDSIIYDGKYDSGIASDAFSLSKCIDFQFCLCLVTFTDILKLCNIISKYLQNEDLNISSASLHIESLISTLQGYTTEAYFDQLYLQAEKIAENIGVTYSEPRHRKVPTRLDDSEHHVPIVLTGKERMKEQFFNDVIELIKEALQSRFSHETMPLLKSIECLNPPKAENIQDLRVLASYYIGDFDADLIEYEYKLLAKLIELSNIGKIGIHKLYLYMVKEGIAKLYPNLNILYRLILTLPVTSSACERSFQH
ncbi:Zinc finger MYM-type protein 1-like [Oopsacas minuta]|uniref:Zinc finger MYM-type protein 1-like n=1 Tax=Oopsacas minuta TaxID=111878 RepID=A0AAV7JQK9_9METZ|nr:Zinc finger MYM-type protein 1-like [Oopsacas minuta]